jgi:competence protein ComEC
MALVAVALSVLAGCSDRAVNPFDPAQDPDPPVVTSFSFDGGVAAWTTDEPALCVIEYGPTGGDFLHYTYESTKVHSTTHRATLLGMEDGEDYFLRIRSTDRAGNEEYSASAALPATIQGVAFDEPVMRLSMIDVGWGLAMSLVTPGGTTVQIDAGRSVYGPRVVDFLYDHGVSYVDYAIATHYDADHYGGFEGFGGILHTMGVGTFFVQDPTHSLESMPARLADTLAYYNIPVDTLTQGDDSASNPALDWDDTPGFFVEVLASGLGSQFIDDPDYYPEDLVGNNDSIVLRITYGDVVFMTMGDAEFFVEYNIIDTFGGGAVRADLLQVAHHGNDDATSELWLDNVDPRIGLISNAMVEAPLEKEVVLQGLRAVGADYFVTDRIFPNTPRDAEPSYGNLIAITDGATIEIVLEPHDW